MLIPRNVKIKKVITETPSIKRLVLSLPLNSFEIYHGMSFIPGQFVMAGDWGIGEAPFGISSDPFQHKFWEIVVRLAGNVTACLHRKKAGDYLTLRGPYGNGFPLRQMLYHDIAAVSGGCGLPPIAALIEYIVRNRRQFNRVWLIMGVATPADFSLASRYPYWKKHQIEIIQTIDQPIKGWSGQTGFTSDIVKSLKLTRDNTYIAMCGPGPMFIAVRNQLAKKGIADDKILVSLERKMSCGIGLCQHCTTGSAYVCADGPIFSYDKVKNNWD